MNTYLRLFAGGQRLGRFLWVRRTYSAFRSFQQRLNSPNVQRSELTTSPLIKMESSISDMLQLTRRDGVAFGISLEKDAAIQIYNFAVQSECIEPGYPYPFFIHELDEKGQLSGGHIPLRALVRDVSSCSILRDLSYNRELLNLAQRYLGYFPSRISCHLSWSLATSLPVTEVEHRYPPATFHYDIAGYNFATAYFYITPVLDLDSGPHEMIRGSHQHKALWMLVRSGRHQLEDLYSYYDQTQTIVILGEQGLGFFQDPSCFHRVRPPTRHHRVLLQFRYA